MVPLHHFPALEEVAQHFQPVNGGTTVSQGRQEQGLTALSVATRLSPNSFEKAGESVETT